MKTIEIMSTAPRAVRAIERLDGAARVLWDNDCGIAPVVDAAGVLVGVLTDRDLCMAAYTQGRSLRDIPVTAVMARTLATCHAEDSVVDVMRTMQELRVHRLPVVNASGQLVGMVSTNDLVRASHARPAAVDSAAVIRTLATIGAPRAGAGAGAGAVVERATARAPSDVVAEAEAGAGFGAASEWVPPVRRKPAARPRTSTPSGAASAKTAPAKKTPVKKAPVKKTPVKKASGAKKTPAKKTPAKKTPAKKTPAKKTPAKKAPTKRTATKKAASSKSGRKQS